jgi:DNA-binding NarL/FixJ family response regulator
MKTRVVVVDDHVSIRQMLGRMLALEGPYEMVGEAGTGFEALEVCRKLKPRLVILDLLLPQLNGVEVLRQLRSESQDARFVVFSGAMGVEIVAEALHARPHAFVHKMDGWEVFCEALRAVQAGCSYFTPFATRVLDDRRSSVAIHTVLSPRERVVLQMVAKGMSTKEIADCLHLAVKTVEHHRAQVMEKLNLHCVAKLTLYAIRQGLISAED